MCSTHTKNSQTLEKAARTRKQHASQEPIKPRRSPERGVALRPTFDDLASFEGAADALLEAAGALGRKPGAYTEAQLARKMRDEQARLPRIEETSLPSDLVNFLAERWIEDLIDASGLTVRQEIIIRMHLSGMDCEKIASALGRRRQSVLVLLREARRKLQATYADGRYAGWYEVYLSEVNRPAYRRRR